MIKIIIATLIYVTLFYVVCRADPVCKPITRWQGIKYETCYDLDTNMQWQTIDGELEWQQQLPKSIQHNGIAVVVVDNYPPPTNHGKNEEIYSLTGKVNDGWN